MSAKSNLVFKSVFCCVFIFLFSCQEAAEIPPEETTLEWQVLQPEDLVLGAHHTQHQARFGKYVPGFNNGINTLILQAIDTVQSHAPDGGGYFIGIRANPTESPVYYNLKLFQKPLIEIPRQASYCSGATYTAFIEAMNLFYPNGQQRLGEKQYESLRMQEPDGSRREDHIKFWGHWNADGFGNHFALVQYSQMGEVIPPKEARSGDFANISWKSGLGHSVIFLGWVEIDGDKKMMYWSSQRGTNGYGDQIVSLQTIKSVMFVRLTHPEMIFEFDPQTSVDISVPGDSIVW